MSIEAIGSNRGRFILILGFLLVLAAMVAWSLEDSRQAQAVDRSRHAAVMDLIARIDENQASIRQNQASIERNQATLQSGLDANAVWRAEMRPLIERMVVALERVEPLLAPRKPNP